MTPFQFSFFATLAFCILGEVASHPFMLKVADLGAFVFMVTTIFFIGVDSYRMWQVEKLNNPFRKNRY